MPIIMQMHIWQETTNICITMPLFLEYRHKAGIFPNTQLHQAPHEDEESDIVWGAAAIAKEIGRTERQAFHLCSKGHLPVTKVGGHWVGSRRRLRRHVIGEDA
jgi:hypothetical protein